MFCLSIHKGMSLEEVWDFLENAGVDVLYGSEEDNGVLIYVNASDVKEIPHFKELKDCVPYTLPAIDWEAQWAAHGLDFRDGMVHLSFEKYAKKGKSLVLKPGPGFGDLSHPTTNIVLEMMTEHLKDELVIDIGCGSGVLSLAACAMGAPEVIGIDIDEAALTHSQENAILNHMEKQCHFAFPSEFYLTTKKPVLVVMNMISSEQVVAWESLPSLHDLNSKLLVSGIRVEERADYLHLVKKWKWHLIAEKEQAGWLGFCFIQHKTK